MHKSFSLLLTFILSSTVALSGSRLVGFESQDKGKTYIIRKSLLRKFSEKEDNYSLKKTYNDETLRNLIKFLHILDTVYQESCVYDYHKIEDFIAAELNQQSLYDLCLLAGELEIDYILFSLAQYIVKKPHLFLKFADLPLHFLEELFTKMVLFSEKNPSDIDKIKIISCAITFSDHPQLVSCIKELIEQSKGFDIVDFECECITSDLNSGNEEKILSNLRLILYTLNRDSLFSKILLTVINDKLAKSDAQA